MRVLIGATALAAAVLCMSAAWAEVKSSLYAVSNGGVSTATVDITSRDGSRLNGGALAMSQKGGSAEAELEADARGGAVIGAWSEAVTHGGVARAVNRSVGKGNSKLDTVAVAESVDGKAYARIIAKGTADRTSQTRVTGSSRVLGNGTSDVEAVSRARRGGAAEANATGVVQRAQQPGQVIHRVEAMATDGGRSVSRGEAYDLD